MTLFGTDGIRGEAGRPPLDDTTVTRVGAALARGATHAPRVVIGRDTRESGEAIERALARGIVAGGGSVTSLGVVPTPAVAYLLEQPAACAAIRPSGRCCPTCQRSNGTSPSAVPGR